MGSLRETRMRWCCLLPLLTWAAGCAAPPPSAGHFEREAVAADDPTASRAGAEILAAGGNAVDAAVAVSFTLAVVRPEACGIGGGGFMVVHITDDGARAAAGRARALPPARDVAFNYREMAPAAVGPGYYEGRPPEDATHGGRAVGVPGTVAGLLRALELYGTLDRARVLAPAIRAADDGFIADEHYAASVRDAAADFGKHPQWKERFVAAWEQYLGRGAVRAGDHVRIPGMGVALRLIARDGAAAVYDGPIAEAIVRTIQRDGGEMTRDDLARYAVAAATGVRTAVPLTFRFRGWTFLTMPPPSSGGVAMGEALKILERILPDPPRPVGIETNVTQLRQGVAAANRQSREMQAFREGPLYLHALAESLKHAFADRSRWLGDPDFVETQTARLISDEYAASRAAAFHPGRTLPPDQYGSTTLGSAPAPPDDHGTSHFSVVDRWGNAVACTETINLGFGSFLAVDGFGFLLNDQMDDFTTQRGRPNSFGLIQSERNLPAPGKRPLSSMTPTIVLDDSGRVEAVAGASGGPRIISAIMQTLLNLLVFGDPAGQAVSRARLHHQWIPNELRLEPGLYASARGPWTPGGPPTLVEALGALGHKIRSDDSAANVQLIVRNPEAGWDAACDPRRAGRPAGR